MIDTSAQILKSSGSAAWQTWWRDGEDMILSSGSYLCLENKRHPATRIDVKSDVHLGEARCRVFWTFIQVARPDRPVTPDKVSGDFLGSVEEMETAFGLRDKCSTHSAAYAKLFGATHAVPGKFIRDGRRLTIGGAWPTGISVMLTAPIMNVAAGTCRQISSYGAR